MEGRIQAFSRNMESQEKKYLGSYEEKYKNVCHFAHIPMYMCLRSKFVYIHASIALKVAYRYKQEIFGDDLGTSKYNIGPWGLKSLQRDMEGHKCVIYQVW